MENNIETKARIYQHYDGSWQGESTTTVNGQSYRIFTSKYRKHISSSATKVETDGKAYSMFTSTDMFNSIPLVKEEARATEKKIREIHYKAIAVFDQKVEDGEIQPVKKIRPEIGTILFVDDVHCKSKGSHANKQVVYKIEHGSFGPRYHTVELDTLRLEIETGARPFSEKFGIGVYFEPDYKFKGSQEELDNLVLDAISQKEAEDELKRLRKEDQEAERLELVEKGKKLITIPKWAKAIIVADLYQNDSDSMTDYFSTSVSRRVYLAFSKTDRNNMAELIKAAQHFPDTAEFPQDDEDYQYTYGHTYLPNYFFGTNRWFGYKVTKDKYFDLQNPKCLDRLYEAAGRGDTYFPQEEEYYPTPESLASKIFLTDNVGDIQVVDYSDKAFAVIGKTKPLKDFFKELGGRFNFKLKCGAGWIFPKTKQEEVESFLKTL